MVPSLNTTEEEGSIRTQVLFVSKLPALVTLVIVSLLAVTAAVNAVGSKIASLERSRRRKAPTSKIVVLAGVENGRKYSSISAVPPTASPEPPKKLDSVSIN